VMYIDGGSYVYNGSSGFAGVNTSITTISGNAVFTNNNTSLDTPNLYGGLYLSAATLTILSATSQNNNGPRIYVSSGTLVGAINLIGTPNPTYPDVTP
jgi:hypothetical protein